MGFEVETQHFKGPLELLLDLIEQRKLFINEISLAKVTDDFIHYIESQEKFPMGESAHFILVAATLVLIKSKSLLPNLELTQEEQGDIKSLEIRLAVYKRIREAGLVIAERFGEIILFEPETRNFVEPVFSPGKISLQSLAGAIQKVIAQIPKVETLPKVVVQKVISLEEMIERLSKRIQEGLKISFREFSGHKKIEKAEKINVIVSFLAMLELVKRGAVRVEQRATFDEIEIETQDVGLPKYS